MNILGQSLKSPENPQIPKGFLNPQISYFWGFIPQGWAPCTLSSPTRYTDPKLPLTPWVTAIVTFDR